MTSFKHKRLLGLAAILFLAAASQDGFAAGNPSQVAAQQQQTAARTRRAAAPKKAQLGRPDKLMPVKQLVKKLFGDVKSDMEASDRIYIPGNPDQKYLGTFYEMESKHLVRTSVVPQLEDAMAKNDLERVFGPTLGKRLRAQGFYLQKQVKEAGTVRYSDPYLDTPNMLATRQGISIRHRQIGSQIGTDLGMFEVKLYTKESANSPVQGRLEIRFRTDSKYSAARMLARDPELERYNPLTYLEKFDPRFKGQPIKPAVILDNQRLEYQLKNAAGEPQYLFTLDRVNGQRAVPVPGKVNVSPGHIEMEIEKMVEDESPNAKRALHRLTKLVEKQFGLQRSPLNKPGTVAQSMGMLDE